VHTNLSVQEIMPEHTRARRRPQLQRSILVEAKKNNPLLSCYGVSLPSSCKVAKKQNENGHIRSNRKRNADVPVLLQQHLQDPPNDRQASNSFVNTVRHGSSTAVCWRTVGARASRGAARATRLHGFWIISSRLAVELALERAASTSLGLELAAVDGGSTLKAKASLDGLQGIEVRARYYISNGGLD
jgi:hypothetical protein